ncbi:MAG TPA: MFS transporter [Nocardioides sp.]|jgi:MFS family permease|nr:MFS transporter [Nocardioides sp.]
MRQAFRQPGFTRLYVGLTASMFGDSVMLLALSMWVKTITGSNAMAGLTFFFMVIPALFAPLLGIWIDRLKRRPLLVWGHLASGLGVLPLVLVRGAGQVWIIWVVAVLYGVSFVVLPAALNGLLKELMPDHLLVDANSSLQTTKESFRLFGPLIGALLFTWLGGWAIALLDAATFAVAAVVIASISVQEVAPEVEESQFWSQLTAGARHLGTDRVLKHVLVGFGITMLVLGFTESSIYALLDAFDKPATFVSVIVAVQGVGAVAGGLASGRVIRRIGEVATCVLGLLVLVAGVAVMAATHSLVVVCLAAAGFGTSLPMLLVAFNTLVQRRSPQAIMGRVSTAVEVLMATPQAVSLALGSLLVVLLSYRQIFAIMCVVTFLAACHIAFWLRHQIRDDVRRVALDALASSPPEEHLIDTGRSQ